jgi:hypothetical protein
MKPGPRSSNTASSAVPATRSRSFGATCSSAAHDPRDVVGQGAEQLVLRVRALEAHVSREIAGREEALHDGLRALGAPAKHGPTRRKAQRQAGSGEVNRRPPDGSVRCSPKGGNLMSRGRRRHLDGGARGRIARDPARRPRPRRRPLRPRRLARRKPPGSRSSSAGSTGSTSRRRRAQGVRDRRRVARPTSAISREKTARAHETLRSMLESASPNEKTLDARSSSSARCGPAAQAVPPHADPGRGAPARGPARAVVRAAAPRAREGGARPDAPDPTR